MKDDLYYYVGKKRIYLHQSPKTSAISYPSVRKDSFREEMNMLKNSYPSDDFLIFPEQEILLVQNDADLKKNAEVKTILSAEHADINVFETEDELPVIVTDELLVKFKKNVSQKKINEFNAANNVSIKESLTDEPNYYVLVTADISSEERIILANKYHESELVVFAQPNFLRLYHNAAIAPDPHFSKQWALENTGQNHGRAGEDINIKDAWAITKGHPSITIAIFDTGVDYEHPDLDGRVNGKPKLIEGFNALDGSNKQQPSPDVSHGTSCAGIAAALSNHIGIAGVAPDCSLMGIKIFINRESDILNDSTFVKAIDKAEKLGVDVINCSWSGVAESQAIKNEINNVKRRGRRGKGCVIVFAAGNKFTELKFPANSPDVLTVTAFTEEGRFKEISDGHGAWGSNFGNEVDICAPGTAIATLANDRKFDFKFEGTSAAAPMVAGTVALMLSINPDLSATQVEDIIKQTARKPTGISNPRKKLYGHGLLNAGEAVKYAQAMLSPIVS